MSGSTTPLPDETSTPPERWRSYQLAATIFLSAFLLFQVEPMVGRFVLPWFGGGPAVWTTCLLFFQCMLLGGYAYAWWVARQIPRRQALVHLTLLAVSLLFLPIGPHAAYWRPATAADPEGHILLLLAVTVGAPYLLLSATAPLLQHWYATDRPDRLPWRLYALSNGGSFLALLTYPFLVEPYFRLPTQAWMWSGVYVVFAALCAGTAGRMRHAARLRVGVAEAGDAAPSRGVVVYWMALAGCGSMLLMATTNEVCQEIAVNPFLWVVPLSLYLLTFILAFERENAYRPGLFARAAGVFAALGCIVQSAAVALSLGVQLAFYLAALFVLCMVCHGELAQARPSPRYLTEFYLAIAGGGALGGVLVALVAPHVFTDFAEYPIALGGACLLGLVGWWRRGGLADWSAGNFAARLPVAALVLGVISGGSAARCARRASPWPGRPHGQCANARWRRASGRVRGPSIGQRVDLGERRAGRLFQHAHGVRPQGRHRPCRSAAAAACKRDER